MQCFRDSDGRGDHADAWQCRPRPGRDPGSGRQRQARDGWWGDLPAGPAGPGTPPELADAIGDFATSLQDIAINALAGVTNDNPEQAARLRDAEATNSKVAALCK